MNLLDSLLDAIVRLEGDALVMHVGEKPYVVTTTAAMNAYRGPLAWGQVELSSRVLTADAVLGMLGQILPLDQRQQLEELGAIEHEVPAQEGALEHFKVVAARGGDDVWLEVRRQSRAAEAEEQPAPVEEPAAELVAPTPLVEEPQLEPIAETQPEPVAETQAEPVAETQVELIAEPQPEVEIEPVEVPEIDIVAAEPDVEDLEELVEVPEFVDVAADLEIAIDDVDDVIRPTAAEGPVTAIAHEEEASPFEIVHEVSQAAPTEEDVDALLAESAESLLRTTIPAPEPGAMPEPVAVEDAREEPAPAGEEAPAPLADEAPAAVAQAPEPELVMPEPRAVVVPLSRSPVRVASTPAAAAASNITVDDLLRVAAARGASAVYVVAQSQPMVRTDGEISALDVGDGEPLTQADVERIVIELSPPPKDAGSHDPSVEWMCDVPGVGRVRCLTFTDHRGSGVILRMIPHRAISADQLGLTPEVQALCTQSDGLVLVTGPRASGKTTLMNAFVDLINRTRSDHVITIEPQIGFVHESRRCFVSQREVRGDTEATLAALRAALREGPDVLFVEDIGTADIATAAMQAAEAGRLVFASISSPSTTVAIERLLELVPADRRSHAQTSLAASLRGVVSQVLVRRTKGGRLAAREVLLNTPAVAGIIQEGRLNQLRRAMEGGGKLGMVLLSDALAGLVRDGTVHVTEAYRRAVDKEALLAALKREGIDTSFAERLA